MNWTDFWKIHPIVNFRISGHDTGQFLENSSKTENLVEKIIFSEFRGATQIDFWKTHPNMDQFSKNGSGSCPDIIQKLNTGVI